MAKLLSKMVVYEVSKLAALCAFGVLTMVGIQGCSGGKTAGTSAAACKAGEVKVEGQCFAVCDGDSSCAQGTYCDANSICKPIVDGVLPTITSVNGSGSVDGAAGHAANHFTDRLVVNGSQLLAANVFLIADGAGLNDYGPLTLVGDEAADRLEVMLPGAIKAGRYTLRVSNQAGNTDTSVTILQGERGVDGVVGTNGALGQDGQDGAQGDPAKVAVGGTGLVAAIDTVTATTTLSLDPKVIQLGGIHCNAGEVLGTDATGKIICQPKPIRDTYTHWGYKTCAAGDELVYSGWAYGTYRDQIGGPSNPVCYQNPNEGGRIAGAYNGANHGGYLVALGLYGASGVAADHSVPGVTAADHRRAIPCAECASPKTCIQMTGNDTCSTGWSLAYTGYLVSGHYNHEGDLNSFCYDVNVDPAIPIITNTTAGMVMSASTGAASSMATAVPGYTHTFCAVCCK